MAAASDIEPSRPRGTWARAGARAENLQVLTILLRFSCRAFKYRRIAICQAAEPRNAGNHDSPPPMQITIIIRNCQLANSFQRKISALGSFSEGVAAAGRCRCRAGSVAVCPSVQNLTDESVGCVCDANVGVWSRTPSCRSRPPRPAALTLSRC
jgi:hypothetical protein